MDDQRHLTQRIPGAPTTGTRGTAPLSAGNMASDQQTPPVPGADVDEDSFELENAPEGTVPYEVWVRMRARRLLREFLRAVPRGEPDAPIAILRPDGVNRIYTRGELSTAIDR